MNVKNDSYILWFEEVELKDIPKVGGKNASLGEMWRELSQKGVKIPNGFAVTAEAYRFFLKENQLEKKINKFLEGLNTQDLQKLNAAGLEIRQEMLAAKLPIPLEQAILQAYEKLGQGASQPTAVAVRSSATAEDLPDASFAGQQETFLNIRGKEALLAACRGCFASLFTDRAISYRAQKGFDQMKVALSIGIQKMVRSDLAASGVMFTIDTESGFRDVILINASYGLGENIVQGVVNPDEFSVFKQTLQEGFRPILQKTLGSKEIKMIYNTRGGTKETRNVPVSPGERQKFSITDDEILTLARWGILIEEHYSKKANAHRPMDIEWAKDGETGELFIVQARPETVQSIKDQNILENYHLIEKGKLIVAGKSVGSKIGQGKARIIKNVKDDDLFQKGDILVTEMTDPDWVPVMKRAAGVVTERGGRTCHAAIVSRELGVPAVIGAPEALGKIKDGQDITISCAEGEDGKVYEGKLKFEVEKISLKDVARSKTKIMMNIAEPDRAFALSRIPNDGIGLARMEFIVNDLIKIHPMALLRFPHLKDPEAVLKIEGLTLGYTKKSDYFVEKLSQGVGKLAAAFYPKDVILRFSDFKSNEYANLIGGREFEPEEENPMLGFRGASRYYDDRYREGFGLECLAVKNVREVMGLKNLKVMIPFCRTIEEAEKVFAEMEKNGLKRGEDGLEVYVMCEIPSNVLLADEFARMFDGFSIGSNDLTQLVLGVDRDSEIVSHLFDERNAAVKKMISLVIQAAKKAGVKIGICGQAPSDYPEFARFLVEQGIDSISLNPDVTLKTTLEILKAESNHLEKNKPRAGIEPATC